MKFVPLINLKLLKIANSFLLYIAEHEKSFITSGPVLKVPEEKLNLVDSAQKLFT